MVEEIIRLASGKKFANSMRSQGLTDSDAINELVDNSFDNEATEVKINVFGEGNQINILIQDNGKGMSAIDLRKSLVFGESRNEDISNKIGRFGFGMPSAILGKTKNAKIYSKTIDNPDYFQLDFNLDRIVETSDLNISPAEKISPFQNEKIKDKIENYERGTIILLEKCDRLNNSREDTISKKISDSLSLTYRKFIEEGKKIYLNNVLIESKNPFFITEEYIDKIGGRKFLPESPDFPLTSEERGKFEKIPIEVEINGEKKIGYITIKLYLLPIMAMHYVSGGKKERKNISHASSKFGIGYRESGFYLIRNKREIVWGSTLNGLFTKHPMLTYFRGEIEFDSLLDDKFGIQNNKSRFHLDEQIIEILKNKIRLIIAQIRTDQQRMTSVIREEGITDLSKKIIQTTYLEKEKFEKERKKERDLKIKKKAYKQIDEDKTIVNSKKEKLKKEIDELLDKCEDFEFVTVLNRLGPLFSWEYFGNKTKISLNQDHPFYRYFWVPLKQKEKTGLLADLLLYSLVKKEQYHRDARESGENPTEEDLHIHWSTILRKYFNNASFLSFFGESDILEDIE